MDRKSETTTILIPPLLFACLVSRESCYALWRLQLITAADADDNWYDKWCWCWYWSWYCCWCLIKIAQVMIIVQIRYIPFFTVTVLLMLQNSLNWYVLSNLSFCISYGGDVVILKVCNQLLLMPTSDDAVAAIYNSAAIDAIDAAALWWWWWWCHWWWCFMMMEKFCVLLCTLKLLLLL